jgi:hypothetical protein
MMKFIYLASVVACTAGVVFGEVSDHNCIRKRGLIMLNTVLLEWVGRMPQAENKLPCVQGLLYGDLRWYPGFQHGSVIKYHHPQPDQMLMGMATSLQL